MNVLAWDEQLIRVAQTWCALLSSDPWIQSMCPLLRTGCSRWPSWSIRVRVLDRPGREVMTMFYGYMCDGALNLPSACPVVSAM